VSRRIHISIYISNFSNAEGIQVIGYKPRPRGMGVVNWLKDKCGLTKTTWPIIAKVFAMYPTLAKSCKYPIIGPIFKYAMMFSPYDKRFTQGVSLPLNIDLSSAATQVALPIDMMKETVRKASYRLQLDRCLCRDGHNCKKYSHEIACIFLGEGAKITERHGLGHEVTADEACAAIDRAAAAGLIGQALWVEVEQFVWGWENEKMENFLEICFCCDCCCTALGVSKNASRDVQRRFKSAGWKAEITSDCVLCERCAPVCPQTAITYRKTQAVASDDCIGCGLCVKECKSNAIKIVLKDPVKPRVEDYFEGLKINISN
jgi:Pyruvate/2-oxoacid:ferredoxin oxidoreductase delta subunit